MVPCDDDITQTKYQYQVQGPESPEVERETPEQWLPPPTSPTTSRRSLTQGPSQNKRKDRAPQLVTKHWLARGRPVVLPDSHRTLANLTGRSYAEAFCDLARVHRPQEPARCTSIASDESHSHGSPSIIKDPALSPKLANGVVQASLQSNDYSEAALTLLAHSTKIGSTGKSPQTDSIKTIQSSVSPDKDVTKCINPLVACCPSITQPPLQQPLCIGEPCTEVGLLDSAKKIADDTYSPETRPASRSEIRGRARNQSSSPKFGCPQCPRRFTRNFDMLRHIRNIHSTQPVETIVALTCTCCGEYLSRKDAFKRHIEKVPNSCIRVAKLKQKPPPEKLSEETYAIRKIAMMEICTRHRSFMIT